MATLFCLAVVRQRWPREAPTLTAAAEELGVSRELAPRLRARFLEPVVELIARTNRPGPKAADPKLEATQTRLRILEALLGVARTIIAAAGIAALAPRRREELVLAVERLHVEHGISYECVADELGLSDRTLRRLRARLDAGEVLAPRSRAPKLPHGQLPEPLATAISDSASRLPNVPLAELHRRFVEDRAELCIEHGHPRLAYTTFARHSGRAPEPPAGAAPGPRRGRDAPENLPFRALALMDTTDIECFGFDFKLIPFMEAHSREIFAHQLCERDRAEHIVQVLEEGQQSCGGVLGLRIDRGTPYLAELTTSATQERGIDRRVARAHTPTDKAIIERFFLTVKDALRSVLTCVDLREGPGDLLWRRNLARTIASLVIAGYLRWGYPYIPQPYIDGQTPRQRVERAPAATEDVIRAALDERVQHHEHAQTVARELHDVYGFRWSMRRWLDAVRRCSCTAEDLREAARRFDRVLLRRCFNCDSRRTPNYLLAVIRDVATDRRERQRQQKRAQRQAQQARTQHEATQRAVEEDEHQRGADPEGAARKAIELARTALGNEGFGLSIAEGWLDHALGVIALRGQTAMELAKSNLLRSVQDEPLRAWVIERIEQVRPSPVSIRNDLDL